jgi:hypothetical protein
VSSTHTRCLVTILNLFGLLVPGGWDEFFRFMGEPYEGNPAEVLSLMEKRAAEKQHGIFIIYGRFSFPDQIKECGGMKNCSPRVLSVVLNPST